MTFVADKKATHAVQTFVLSLNTHLASTPQKPAERAGAKRAAKREAEQAKAMAEWHKAAETAGSERPASRQSRRHAARIADKQDRSHRKAVAKKTGAPGGSATIRA